MNTTYNKGVGGELYLAGFVWDVDVAFTATTASPEGKKYTFFFFLFSKPKGACTPAYWCRQAQGHLQYSTTTILKGTFLRDYLTQTFSLAVHLMCL